MLQDRLCSDLKNAIKVRSDTVSYLKVIVGEIQRSRKKVVSDGDVCAILRILANSEKERLASLKATSSEYLEFVESYIPAEITEDDVRKWIVENIDFSSLDNKNKAIGITKKHFDGVVDGNLIKKVVESI